MAIEVRRNLPARARRLGAAAEPPPARAAGPNGQGLPARERMFFTERLALLLETGQSLHGALEALAKQAAHPGLRATISELSQVVTEGATFSSALRQQSKSFSATYINLVSAAEEGGFLPKVLEELIALERKGEQLRSTVRSAFSYPAFLVVFSFAVVVFVLAVVFPKFAVMFESIADELPWSTQVLMQASHVLVNHWPWVLISAAAVCAGVWVAFSSTAGARFVDRLKLELPGLRELMVEIYLVQSMRVLSLSLGHGVSVLDAFRACRDVVPNRRFRAFVDEVIEEIEQGRGIASGFDACDFLPLLAKQMVRTGEDSASLPLVLDRMAGFYEGELNRRLQTFARMIEPLMLLVMGAVVGIIVASLILPIFKLSKGVT